MTAEHRIDVVGILSTRWRLCVALALLGAAAGAAYGFLAPKWYEATLTVVPAQSTRDALPINLAPGLSAISGIESGGSAGVQRIQAVLTSNSVADEVIDRFNLRDHYEVEHREHAREALRKHCRTGVDRKSGVVSLTCEDQDPQRAMEIATYFGEVGNRVFGRVSASSAKEERRFLEAQVIKARQDVEDSSRKLREFQEQHKVVDLPEQSKAVISAMAAIKGELISKQLELSYLSSFSARTEASVVQLQQQIAIMESKLKQLEDTHRASNAAPPAKTGSATEKRADFFPEAMTVPQLRFELEQLLREQKIRETVFALMTQRYEMARIDEARDTSTFQILDKPTLPTYKTRPKRARAIILGFAAGIAMAFAWALLPVWWRTRERRVA